MNQRQAKKIRKNWAKHFKVAKMIDELGHPEERKALHEAISRITKVVDGNGERKLSKEDHRLLNWRPLKYSLKTIHAAYMRLPKVGRMDWYVDFTILREIRKRRAAQDTQQTWTVMAEIVSVHKFKFLEVSS